MKPASLAQSLTSPLAVGSGALCEQSAHFSGNRDTDSARAINQIYDPVVHHLPLVEQRLQAELQTRYEALSPILRHGIQLGGKRMRPAMLLLCGLAVGEQEISDNHITLAVVLEMVHTATLIHDDVLDAAETRRRVQTINAVWGDHVSILLGDYLFSQAFRLSATLGSTEPCRWIGEASRKVCEGELRQVLARDLLDLDQASYIEMIQGKTAELCSVACRLGGSMSGAAEPITSALAQYGTALGIAFQIADDHLDLWGDDQAVGKTLGTDLEQGKWTLPILHLLQTSTPSESAAIRDILAGQPEQRLEKLLPILRRSDARQYTLAVAESYSEMACQAIASLPNTPAKRSLIDLANFAVSRTF